VLTVHDLFAVLRPQWVSPAFHRWYSWLLPRLARRAAHIVTVSEYSKAAICQTFGVSAEHVTVTPLGVSPQFRPPTAAEAAQVRASFDLPERFVLALGSLEPRKNLAGAVAAWQRLPAASRPPLVVAGGLGKAAVFGRYDASALEAGGARFLGYVPDELLPALYGAATLFIYPSFEEGFGLPPVEALACGAPVLTSNTSALREFCAPYATLVDPADPDAIAVALREALERSESAAEKAARAHAVSTRFTWEATAKGLAEAVLRYC
jgi:glycosyltransferase involved in cell wall biosynthesis